MSRSWGTLADKRGGYPILPNSNDLLSPSPILSNSIHRVCVQLPDSRLLPFGVILWKLYVLLATYHSLKSQLGMLTFGPVITALTLTPIFAPTSGVLQIKMTNTDIDHDIFYILSLRDMPDANQESLANLLEDDPKIFKSLSGSKALAVLHASQESRQVGLKHYSLEFGTKFESKLGSMTLTLTSPAKIYVNWNCDIILPTGCANYHTMGGFNAIMNALEEGSRVCRLAVEYGTAFQLKYYFSKHPLPLNEVILYCHIPSGEMPSDEHTDTNLDLNIISGNQRYELVDRRCFLQDIEHDTDFYEATDVARLDLSDLGWTIMAQEMLDQTLLDIARDEKLANWKPPKVEVMLLRCHEEES
ncbi:uncharacterized protein PAC_10024 [Phialocephala subalpina]|uniref:2EXR domain-containing protein n=1 Tax=Phialocephala subalpina TaxID=576137 RepID=A0A1L7X524_9HELO|nr:uncharacterized protein PAC_10024 [Phialocephala subalpina]